MYAQSGQKFSSGGNSLSNGEFFGTLNNFPINVKVNNTLRSSFTTTGFDVYGNLHSTKNTMVDSILSAWKVLVADALSVGGSLSVSGSATIIGDATVNGTLKAGLISISGNNINSASGTISFGNNNLITTGDVKATNITTLQAKVNDHSLQLSNHQANLVNQQSSIDSIEIAIGVQESVNVVQQQEINELSTRIGDINDSVSTLKDQITNINSSQWQNNGTNSIAYSGTAIVNGDFQSGSISTGQLTISDNFIAPKGDFDTLKAAKQLFVNHNLILGSDSGSMTSDIASRVERLMIQSDSVPYAMAKDVIIVAKNEGKIGIGMSEGLIAKLNVQGNTQLNGDLNVSGNANLGGNLSSSGTIEANTIQAGNINTANITISDKISTKTAEFDTLRVAERMEVEKYIQSDTLHALSSLEVNNSLRLKRDITVMYAEVSTKDTAVALMLQKDMNATVAIGAELIPIPGEAKPKLTVSGNTKLDGALNVSGNISTAGNIDANCVTTSCLNVSGQTNFDSLQVTGKIKTTHIVPADGDSIISIGNNTVKIDVNNNHIFADYGKLKIQSHPQLNQHTVINAGNTGNVGIGTETPSEKLTVAGNLKTIGNIIATGSISANGLSAITSSDNCNGSSIFRIAYNYDENLNGCTTPLSAWDLKAIKENDTDHRFEISNPDYAGNIFTLTKLGRTGFGTISPQAKVEINEPDEFSTATVFKIHRNGFYGNGNIMEVTKRDKYATNPPLSLFTIKDTGNVGIGINDPQALLDVNGTGHFLKLGIGIANPQLKLHVYGDDGSSGGLRLENSDNNISSAWDFNPVVENSTGRLMIGTPGDPLFAITADDGVNIKSKLNIGSLTPNPTTYDLTIHNGTSANLSSIQLANASSGNTPMDGLVMSSSEGDAVFSLMEDGDYRFGSGNPMTGQFNEKMVIKANGNVGIGTNDPSEKLDVKGNIRINENDIFFRSLLPDGNHGLGWYGDPDNNSQTANSKSFAGVDVDGPVLFGFKGGALGSTENGKKIVLRWDQKGNVGIGTFLPLEKLQIGNIFTFHDGGNKVIARNFYSDGLNKRIEQGKAAAIYFGDGTLGFRVAPDGAPLSEINWINALDIDNNGNVGIGTSCIPEGFALAVLGKIKAREVEIENGTTPWCDYVFEPEYKQMGWQEKSAYVKKNKHLPSIAPGKEIEANGIKTGETMKGILFNVEENTLDIIELYKINEQLMEIVKKQKEEIAELKKAIER